MINKKYLKLLRSTNRFQVDNFIYNIIAKRIVDSLELLKINLNQILELGINENKTYNYLQKKFPKSKIDRADLCISKNNLNRKINFLEIDLDNLILKNEFYNLIYSNCFLHLADDFEKNLRVILNSLKSDSFFIAAIPDKENMFQVLNSMYETDLFFYKGAYRRTNQTIEIENILSVLKNLKFDTPSIYSDSFSINYSIFKNLLIDIKNMNLSYCHMDKKRKFEYKRYFNKLEEFYHKKYFKKEYYLDVKINIISAWKK